MAKTRKPKNTTDDNEATQVAAWSSAGRGWPTFLLVLVCFVFLLYIFLSHLVFWARDKLIFLSDLVF